MKYEEDSEKATSLLMEGGNVLPFFKLRNTDYTYRLAFGDTDAFKLLLLIVSRVKINDEYDPHLKKFQCFIGAKDAAKIGVSRMILRRTTKRLINDHQIATKTTTLGTIVTVLKTSIFDFEILGNNHKTTTDKPQKNQRSTTKQPLTIEEEEEFKKENIKRKKNYAFGFSYKDKVFTGLTAEIGSQLKETYPVVDVNQELREMKQWLIDNEKTDPKTDIPRFVRNWLSRAQKGRNR